MFIIDELEQQLSKQTHDFSHTLDAFRVPRKLIIDYAVLLLYLLLLARSEPKGNAGAAITDQHKRPPPTVLDIKGALIKGLNLQATTNWNIVIY